MVRATRRLRTPRWRSSSPETSSTSTYRPPAPVIRPSWPAPTCTRRSGEVPSFGLFIELHKILRMPGGWRSVGVMGQIVVAVFADVVVFLARFRRGIDVHHGHVQVLQLVHELVVDLPGDGVSILDR